MRSVRETNRLGKGYRAFTLIELLVVIAIIAILAAILFPVFAKARQRAVQSKCISQMKQIGTALIQYAADNDGRLPWAWRSYHISDADQQKYSIVNALNPYVKQTVTRANLRDSIWYCTALPNNRIVYPPPYQDWAMIYYSFFGEGTPGDPRPGSGKPSMAHLMGTPIDGPYNFAPWSPGSRDTFAKYHRSPAGMPAVWDQRIPGTGDQATKAAGGEWPHFNNSEVLCLDGHVRPVSEKMRADQAKSPWFPASQFDG